MKSPLPGGMWILLGGVALSGCSGLGHRATLETQHYQCGTLPLTVTLKPQPAQAGFLLDGERLQLPQVVSASGTKYSNGRYTLWTKGDHAFVQRGDHVIVDDCVLVR